MFNCLIQIVASEISNQVSKQEAEAKKRLEAEIKANKSRIEKIAKKSEVANQAVQSEASGDVTEEAAAE